MKSIFLCLFLFLSAVTFGHIQSPEYVSDDNQDTEIQDIAYRKQFERILSFHSDITVNKDASLTITEKIHVNSKGVNISRGIFRSLPIRRNLNNRTYEVKYDIITVTREGKEEKFHKKTDSDWLKVYFGSSDKILEPGEYTYEFKYTVNKQIGFFANYDELYWNVSGTEWDFPIDSATAAVHLPIGSSIIQHACYTGLFGSTEKNCTSLQVDSNTMSWTATNLKENEGLTIALGFKSGIITRPTPPNFIERYGVLIALIIIFFYYIYLCFKIWKEHGIDPVKPTVIPQFNPPDGLSPSILGYLHYEKIKNNTFTVSLINLAIKKYICIEEEKVKKLFGLSSSVVYKLKKLKGLDALLPKEEVIIMQELFKSKNTVTIDGEYKSNVEQASLNQQSAIRKQFEPLLKEGRNLNYLANPAMLLLATFIISFVLANVIEGKTETINYGILMLLFLGIPYVIYKIIQKRKQSTAIGCLKIILALTVGFGLITTASVFVFSAFNNLDNVNIASSIFFISAGIIVLLIMQYLIKKPAIEKLRLQADIEGFKMYMSAAENEQIKFHNAPQITPQLFEKYLPYAIIFQVDDIWGKKLNALLADSSIAYEPSWYLGSTFNATTFGRNLSHSFSESLSKSSSRPSSSSGGSSSSGSSGGGSSGGGGGGGGGGGW